MTDKKKILVVIDMQNDFIDGPLGTPEARGIVDKVCEKIREGEWDYILYTLDTHSEEYLETQEGRKLPIKHCIKNDSGWMLNKDVMINIASKPPYKYERILKNTFGTFGLITAINRSDIWDCGCMDDYYGGNTIDLTLVGVCTDICVISNALLLKAYFPEMNIIVDAACCAGSSPEKHRMALEVMKSCQIDILNNPNESESPADQFLREYSNYLHAGRYLEG